MVLKNAWWGRSTNLDLHGCNYNLITNPEVIARFVHLLAKKLKMKRVGNPHIKRFGHHKLRGYSMMQFIETSTIVAHFDEFGNRAFIDIFSCKKYDPKPISEFCKKFFKASNYFLKVEDRK